MRVRRLGLTAILGSGGLVIALGVALFAQEPDVQRPGPPSREDFEADTDRDGVPEGWYNLRDARLATGGVVGTDRVASARTPRMRRSKAGRSRAGSTATSSWSVSVLSGVPSARERCSAVQMA